MRDVEVAIGRHVDELDVAWPVLVWDLHTTMRVASSAPLGGGVGERRWIVNAQVPRSYARTDIEHHLETIATANGCAGAGAGMLTAAAVEFFTQSSDSEVRVWATVGITLPTWAAARDVDVEIPVGPGTINLVAVSSRRLGDAALVNAVMTMTEAKTQALLDCNVPGTGTASDALCVACPTDGGVEKFGGPRSSVGSALARAVYDAVRAGIVLARGSEGGAS